MEMRVIALYPTPHVFISISFESNQSQVGLYSFHVALKHLCFLKQQRVYNASTIPSKNSMHIKRILNCVLSKKLTNTLIIIAPAIVDVVTSGAVVGEAGA